MEEKLRSAILWAQENNYVVCKRYNYLMNVDVIGALLLQNNKSRLATDEARTLLGVDASLLRAIAYGWDGSAPPELTTAKPESAQGQAYELGKRLSLEFIK